MWWYSRAANSNGAKLTHMSMTIALWFNSQWKCIQQRYVHAVHCVNKSPTQIFVHFSIPFLFSSRKYEFIFYAVCFVNWQQQHTMQSWSKWITFRPCNQIALSSMWLKTPFYHLIAPQKPLSVIVILIFCRTVDFCRQTPFALTLIIHFVTTQFSPFEHFEWRLKCIAWLLMRANQPLVHSI